jgi:hypothetical protein
MYLNFGLQNVGLTDLFSLFVTCPVNIIIHKELDYIIMSVIIISMRLKPGNDYKNIKKTYHSVNLYEVCLNPENSYQDPFPSTLDFLKRAAAPSPLPCQLYHLLHIENRGGVICHEPKMEKKYSY